MTHASIKKKPRLKAILAQDYPVPAKRPVNSVLSSQHLSDTFCNLPQWEEALRLCQG
jgi:dTDP-4-dehydrorhamnose reductase